MADETNGRPGPRERRWQAKALKQRWQIPEAKRKKLVEAQIDIALDSNESPRDRTRAFAAIVAADRVNIDSEKEQGDINVNVGVQVSAGESVRTAIEHDPEYLKYLEQRQLGEVGNPASLGTGDHERRISCTIARQSDERSSNGHDQRSGRSSPIDGDDAA
ncbi:MAG: hypothetical protein U0872_14125 [Planctomycetaceae bacterium]